MKVPRILSEGYYTCRKLEQVRRPSNEPFESGEWSEPQSPNRRNSGAQPAREGHRQVSVPA